MNWVSDERRARGLAKGGLNENEMLFGVFDRLSSEAREAFFFVAQIAKNPIALALATSMAFFYGISLAKASAENDSQIMAHNFNTAGISTTEDNNNFLAVGPVVVQEYITDDEALVSRYARIQSAAIQLEANPDAWDAVPQSCRKSMMKFWIYDGDSTDSQVGSASLIDSQRVEDAGGGVAWIHRFITADHVVRGVDGNVLEDGQVILFPGSHTDQDSRFMTLGYLRFVDENGIPQDSGVVSVVAFGEQGQIEDPDVVPLGIQNVRAVDELLKSNVYYTFDYPGIINSPNFTVGSMMGQAAYDTGNMQNIVGPFDNSSTVAKGSSGGAQCDINGNQVGVVTGYEGEWESKYYVEGNPLDIQSQIALAVNQSLGELEVLGFHAVSK